MTGDNSTRTIANDQNMKFAALEGLYNGSEGAGLVAVGFFSDNSSDPDNENLKDFNLKLEIPNILSYMAFLDWNAFVPGVNDLINGNEKYGIMSYYDRIERGKIAIDKLSQYKEARKSNNTELSETLKAELTSDDFQKNYFKYFGYGYYDDPRELIPNIPLTFYSFHTMVGLGFFFILLFIFSLVFLLKGTFENKRWFMRLAIISIPLAYLASQAGWIVAEVGRQPWVVQDLMPNVAAVTRISAGSVKTTFWLFAILFTVLLIGKQTMLRVSKPAPTSTAAMLNVINFQT